MTSLGGVGSTFLLEWLKRLHRTFQREADSLCAQSSNASTSSCGCPALAVRGSLPRHLISCHVDDDGLFKHLADPASLSGFGAGHRAVFLVGSPLSALASVFRRRFQCWHLHRLHDCWFTRRQRNGKIPCVSPAIDRLRQRYGAEAATCRVPPVGPLASFEAYAMHGADLFGAVAQVRGRAAEPLRGLRRPTVGRATQRPAAACAAACGCLCGCLRLPAAACSCLWLPAVV